MTGIPAGTGLNDRLGHKIKVTGLKMRIHTDSQKIDSYVIVSPNAYTPSASDFETCIGGVITETAQLTHKELVFMHNYQGANFYRSYNRRFRKGIPVSYNNTGQNDVDGNRISLVLKNESTSAISLDISWVIYYTDS